MNVVAAYTGTFDPLTDGHSNLIARAASMFDTVLVAVASATGKDTLFSCDERVQLASEALADLSNVKVLGYSGMTVEFAREHGATVLVRGLRTVSDLEYELPMDVMNKHLAGEINTVYLAPPGELRHVSSSLIKQVAGLGGDVAPFVHPAVDKALKQRLAS